MRQPHDPDAPQSAFLRQYRAYHNYPQALHRSRIYISVTGCSRLSARRGKNVFAGYQRTGGLLYYLHQQPRFGWRITLLPYWNCTGSKAIRRGGQWVGCDVKTSAQSAGTTAFTLKSIAMDVHAGNLVHSASGLKLIDWSMPEMVISRWNWRRCGWKIRTAPAIGQ